MRKIVSALSALAAATVATAAGAASTVVAGNPATPTSIYFNYTDNVGGTFGNNNPTQSSTATGIRFTDAFTFTTSIDRLATVDITSSYPIVNGRADFSQNVNFVSNGVRLNATVVPATSTGQNEERFLANFRLPAGVQNITVRGASGVNGVYAGVLSLAGGVPEPSSWAMMIIGFGLTGAAMRRRRSTAAKVAFA